MPPDDPESYDPTRRSLITRLKNIDDQEGWREFFNTYWRLIYSVARKSGLDDGEAQDLVQETVLSVSNKIAGFRHDPARGSFKNWLMLITRSRIADMWRKKHRRPVLVSTPDTRETTTFHTAAPDPDPPELERLWDREWEAHLLNSALRQVKSSVSIQHFQIFELAALQHQPPSKIARALRISLARVYLVKHRVARLLKKEVSRLKTRMEQGSTSS